MHLRTNLDGTLIPVVGYLPLDIIPILAKCLILSDLQKSTSQ